MELTSKELMNLNRMVGIIAGVADCLKDAGAKNSLNVVVDELSNFVDEKLLQYIEFLESKQNPETDE